MATRQGSPTIGYGGDAASYRSTYRNVSEEIRIGTGDTTVDAFIPKKAKHTIWVQRVIVEIITDAAQTMTFQDDASTPEKVFHIAASPGLGTKSIDYGPRGFPLTENKDLDIVLSAAGLGANVVVEAYMAPSSTMTPSEM